MTLRSYCFRSSSKSSFFCVKARLSYTSSPTRVTIIRTNGQTINTGSMTKQSNGHWPLTFSRMSIGYLCYLTSVSNRSYKVVSTLDATYVSGEDGGSTACFVELSVSSTFLFIVGTSSSRYYMSLKGVTF